MAALSGQANGRSGRTFRLGLQMADFILSRTSSLSARPSHFYHMDLGCGWPISYRPVYGVYQRPSRAIFLSRPASFNGHSVNNAAAVAVLSPNCQISTFGLCVADFILSHIRNLSAARPSHFTKGSQSESQLYQRQPQRFIKAGSRLIKPMAVLSNQPKPNGHFIKTEQAQWQVYQANGRFIKKLPNWPDLQIYATGCKSHMIPCERLSAAAQAILAAMISFSEPMAVLSSASPKWPWLAKVASFS